MSKYNITIIFKKQSAFGTLLTVRFNLMFGIFVKLFVS